MKAGTAHKMVFNLLTICAMIKNDKVYEDMMLNLNLVNLKLKNRMINIVYEICCCDELCAKMLLKKTVGI